MQFVRLKNILRDFTIFSLQDIKLIEPEFHRRRLHEWCKKGYIERICKGYYVFSESVIDENVLFEIANRIYSPSYISLETAFSYYQFIPESVYAVLSISSRRTFTIGSSAGTFHYRSVKPDLFFGYNIVSFGTKVFKIATPEKAILDYLYLNPNKSRMEEFNALRLDREMVKQRMRKELFTKFLDKYVQKSLNTRARAFWNYLIGMKNDD